MTWLVESRGWGRSRPPDFWVGPFLSIVTPLRVPLELSAILLSCQERPPVRYVLSLFCFQTLGVEYKRFCNHQFTKGLLKSAHG